MKTPEYWSKWIYDNCYSPISGHASVQPSDVARIQADAKPYWAPISEAPKDGTVLLCYWPGVLGGRYSIETACYTDGIEWHEPHNHENLFGEPTHFMPLPNPPKA